MKSKDQKTKLGCVIVGPDKEIRSTGYNSFPRGINDNIPHRQERPEKYFWFAHAERNAIYNSARAGISLKNCCMYVTSTPCCDCAIAIIQSGITKVVVHKHKNQLMPASTKSHLMKKTQTLFEEAGVDLVFWEGAIAKLQVIVDGQNITDQMFD